MEFLFENRELISQKVLAFFVYVKILELFNIKITFL